MSTTKADYWVFYDGGCYIWITTSKLNYVVSNFGIIRKFIGKGDTKYKKAYLMKKDIIPVEKLDEWLTIKRTFYYE